MSTFSASGLHQKRVHCPNCCYSTAPRVAYQKYCPYISHYKAPRTEDDFLKSLAQLLAAVSINERVYKRIAYNKDQKKVKVAKVTFAVRVCGTNEYENEVEKEWSPTDDENPEQDGQSDSSLHAGGLPAALVESSDAPGVNVRQNEHVQVQDRREHKRHAKKRDETSDDRVVRVVHDKQRAGGDACEPNHRDDGHGSSRGHDAVVAKRVKDGDVAVRRDGAQERQRGHDRAADHDVDDVVQVL